MHMHITISADHGNYNFSMCLIGSLWLLCVRYVGICFSFECLFLSQGILVLQAASLAKRRLSSGRFKVWGCEIIVDWADPQEEPDEDTMSKVAAFVPVLLRKST